MAVLKREEKLFLEAQAELMAWTRPQPGENQGKAKERVEKVKSLMLKALEVLEVRMARLALLRNQRDRSGCSRRQVLKEEIDPLKDSCRTMWGLLAQLCEQGPGAREFLLEIKDRMHGASQRGSQAVRRSQAGSQEVSQQAQQPMQPVQPSPEDQEVRALEPEEEGVRRESVEDRKDGAGPSSGLSSKAKPQEGAKEGGKEDKLTKSVKPVKDERRKPVVSLPRLDMEKASKMASKMVDSVGRQVKNPGVSDGGQGRPRSRMVTPVQPVGPPAQVKQDDGHAVHKSRGGGGDPRTDDPDASEFRTYTADTSCLQGEEPVGVTGGRTGSESPAQPDDVTGGHFLSEALGASDGKVLEMDHQEPEDCAAPILKGQRPGKVKPKIKGNVKNSGGGGRSVGKSSDATRDPGCPEGAGPVGSADGNSKTRNGSRAQPEVTPQRHSQQDHLVAEEEEAMETDLEGQSFSEEEGELPGAQDHNWGESEMGPLLEECPAMKFIREQEGEGSQASARVDSCGAHHVLGGSGWPVGWESLVDNVDPPAVEQVGGDVSAPIARPVVDQVGDGGDQEVGDGRSPPRVVLPPSQEANLMGALQEGRSFANVAGSRVPLDHIYSKFGALGFREQPGGQPSGAGSWSRGAGGPERQRRNVVQLKFRGSGPCPSRGVVVDMVLDLGFRVAELFAVIHPHTSTEFDVSFMTPVIMESFLTRYELVKGAEKWRDFRVVALTRQDDVKNVTILVRNESLPPQDIVTWLSRFGQLQSSLVKNLDQKGIWTGAWLAKVKLIRSGNSVRHIPASAFIGRDRIMAFYPGQPRLCFKCGSPTHFSADCTTPRCVRCNGFGHSAERCALIKCNLCGEMGHPFSRCPRAFRGFTSGGAEESSGAAAAGGAKAGAGGGAAAQDPAERGAKKKNNQQVRRQDKRRQEREEQEVAGPSGVAPASTSKNRNEGKSGGQEKKGKEGAGKRRDPVKGPVGGRPSGSGSPDAGGPPQRSAAKASQKSGQVASRGTRVGGSEESLTPGQGQASQKRARSDNSCPSSDPSAGEEEAHFHEEEPQWETQRGKWKRKRGVRPRDPSSGSVGGDRGERPCPPL